MTDTAGSPAADPAAEFMDTMARLFAKAARIEQEPVDTGNGVLLYTSEVHLIDLAGRFPDESMSAFAARLGITKGAVSQTAKKLEEKGFVLRTTRDGDNRTTYLCLTDAGRRAFDWHAEYHARVNGRLAQVFSGLSQGDRKNVQDLFFTLEKIFDDCPEIRKSLSRT